MGGTYVGAVFRASSNLHALRDNGDSCLSNEAESDSVSEMARKIREAGITPELLDKIQGRKKKE